MWPNKRALQAIPENQEVLLLLTPYDNTKPLPSKATCIHPFIGVIPCALCSYTNNFEGAEKMVELIQSYPELCGSIDRVASKPFNADVHVRADDFPVS